jgi:hypothetical protein
MKEINLPISQTFSLSFDRRDLDMSNAVDVGDGRIVVELGPIVNETISATVATARQNGGKVLYATTSIEQQMESLLLEFFMGPFEGQDDRREIFEREVLQSSALSYNAKRALVTKIVNERALLEGREKSSLQALLRRIMEWRNAFAHGKIQHDSRAGCFIKHYSGEAKTLALTDTYWEDVERAYNDCSSLLEKAKRRLEANAPDKAPTPPPPGGAA